MEACSRAGRFCLLISKLMSRDADWVSSLALLEFNVTTMQDAFKAKLSILQSQSPEGAKGQSWLPCHRASQRCLYNLLSRMLNMQLLSLIHYLI